jgi:succinate dehydrogenase/fumarate reductase flavoprotein subunit
MIDIEQEGRDMEAIRKETEAHQTATLGHVLTQEELDGNEEEYRKERMKRFEGLTEKESVELMQRETDEFTATMKKNGFDYDDERVYDENLSEEERQEYTARELAAAKKTLHEKIMSSRQQRSDSPRCVKTPAA